MADPADVVPLRRGGSRPLDEPAAIFADVTDPARALSLHWSPDQQAIRLGIESRDQAPSAVVLSADDLLDLVRALLEGLGRPGTGSSALATVLPLRPRKSQPFTGDS